jgi:hypothetical protein
MTENQEIDYDDKLVAMLEIIWISAFLPRLQI